MDMSADEIARGARAASLQRAQSPANLICKLDGSWSQDHPFHADSFYSCMNYRHQNVIGDQDPWTFWQEIDGPLPGPKQPVPPLPVGLMDWQVRALAGAPPVGVMPPIPPPAPPPGGTPSDVVPRVWTIMTQSTWPPMVQKVDANGNLVYDNSGNPVLVQNPATLPYIGGGWNGYSWSVFYDASTISPLIAPYDMRITIVGSYTLDKFFIGAANAANWRLINLNHQLFFWTDSAGNPLNPNDSTGIKSKSVVVNFDDNGNYVPVVTMKLGLGIDPTNGFWISGYLDPNGNGLAPNTIGYLGGFEHWIFEATTNDPVTGVMVLPDLAENTDRSDTTVWYDVTDAGWTNSDGYGYAMTDLCVLTIEGLYDPSQVPAGQLTTPDTTPTSRIIPRTTPPLIKPKPARIVSPRSPLLPRAPGPRRR